MHFRQNNYPMDHHSQIISQDQKSLIGASQKLLGSQGKVVHDHFELMERNFPTINSLMTHVSQDLRLKGRYKLTSTDQVSHTLAKCTHQTCSAYILISHTGVPNVSFKIAGAQCDHQHQNETASDIQIALDSSYRLGLRIKQCQQVFSKSQIGNYFYNFLQPYKVLSDQDKRQNQQNCQVIPYLLPTISSEKNIPVVFRVYKAKFNHLKRLELCIIKTSIMENDITKFQNLHYLTGSFQDNELTIVIMALTYSFLSNVKCPIFKMEKSIYEKVKQIQDKRKKCAKILGAHQKCLEQLMTIYQRNLNQNFDFLKFQVIDSKEIKELKNIYFRSEQSYKAFSSKSKEPGVKVAKLRKWNVLINAIQKSRINKVINQIGNKTIKFDDSKFIQITDQAAQSKDQSQENSQSDMKPLNIHKKETCIIEQLIVGRFQTDKNNIELEDLRKKIRQQEQEHKGIRLANIQIQNFIDLI